jgi:hypothetical protein
MNQSMHKFRAVWRSVMRIIFLTIALAGMPRCSEVGTELSAASTFLWQKVLAAKT